MQFKIKLASVVAVVATMTTAVAGTSATRAAAQDLVPGLVAAAPTAITPAVTISVPVVQPTTHDDDAASASDDSDQPATLDQAVDAQPQDADLSKNMKCLAGAIYFEAKGETLAGQLAVGRVIVARSKSGRFPDSYCGVVYQRSQFSFIRGKGMPAINTDSQSWHNAVAIAQIADSGSWKSRSEGALYFHAASVSPHWRMTKLAQVDDHVFYR